MNIHKLHGDLQRRCDIFLVHDYFAVDVEIMWLVIEDDIPVLKQQIQAYIAELESSEE